MAHTNECDVCGQPASSTCARCNSVAYCGKEHQKLGWTEHQRQCSKTQTLFALAATMGVPASMVMAIAANTSAKPATSPPPSLASPPPSPRLTGTCVVLKDIGNAAYRRGDYTRAIAAYTAAVSASAATATDVDRVAALSNRAQVSRS